MSLEGASILVTGGAGIIGRPTVALLASIGVLVRNFDRVPSRVRGVEDLVGDLRDSDAVAAAVAGASAVVHLGAIPGPGYVDDATTYAINTVGSFNVFWAAAAQGVRKVVYASSINANGLPLGRLRPPSVIPYSEEEMAPIGDAYSLSKVANEDAARMASTRWGLSLTGLRFPLVRDIRRDRGVPFREHLVAALRDSPTRQAYEGFSYLDAGDAARSVVAALTHETPPAPGILVAAPTTYLVEDTREALTRLLADVPLGPIEGHQVGLDLSLARDLLDFRAETLLEDVGADLLVTTRGSTQ